MKLKTQFRAISALLAVVMLYGNVGSVFAEKAAAVRIDGDTYIEAEDYTVMNAPMAVIREKSAMGGAYVAAGPGASDNNSPSRGYAHLVYKISVPSEDSYFVWMRVRSAGRARYYMNFDDGVYKKRVELADVQNKDEWIWVCADKYWLSAGGHELKIRYSSRDMKYDAFYITSDRNFTPEGAKPSIVPPDELYKRDENGNVINPYYVLPTYLPPDEHPRLLFRKKDIARIKNNLEHEQNASAYKALLANAEYKTDGRLPELKYGQAHNINTSVELMIEANALLYQLTDEKEHGLKAIGAARNFVESVMIDESNDSSTGRDMMQAMWSVALCYDWCYDLLTDEDKDFLLFYMLYNTRYSEASYPPTAYDISTGHSEIIGHILEFQLLGGMMGIAVAAYDEAPDYYNIVAGRIQQYIIPAVNRFNQSGMYTEGSTYGIYRHYYEILNNYIFKAMGHDNVYYEEGLSTLGYLYLRQPDAELLFMGDCGGYYLNKYITNNYCAFFLLGNMLHNPYFKTEYYRAYRKELKTETLPGHMTPAMWLVINDVEVPCDRSFRDFPLTMYTGDDFGLMLARTGWNEGFDSNDALCLMNLKTRYIYGHSHKDAGHFSLYYKGILALDSGIYQGSSFVNSKGVKVTSVGYGKPFHQGYTRQSIAHNTMLVDDPTEEVAEIDKSSFTTVDGGQRWDVKNWPAMTIEDFDGEAAKSGEILSYNWGPDLREPEYSYMKGDLTYAYTSKVENFQRSFMFFNFKDETYPAALIVFDAVRSSSPNFKKTWLLHCEEEPVIDGNAVTVTRDTVDYNGRLINQSLLPDNGFSIEKIGQDFDGVSKYKVKDTLYEMKPLSDTAEVGNWRVEISPTKAEKQSYFLNVLQLSENEESIVPLEARLVENTDDYAGVEIKEHVAYFRKDGLSKAKNFTIHPGKTEQERFFAVTGLAEGKWTVSDKDGNVVAEEYAYAGHDSISFRAVGDEFALKFTPAPDAQAPDYSVFGLADEKEKSVDVCIDGFYQTFQNEWVEQNGVLYAPIAETLDKFDIYNYTEDDKSVTVNDDLARYKFVYGQDGIIRLDNLLYAPVSLLEKTLSCTVRYDGVASVADIMFGNRARDRALVYIDDDPSVARIATVQAEGDDVTQLGLKAIDGNTETYASIIGQGSYTAVLSEPTTISRVGLFWIRGSERQEIFEMYVSQDGENWKEVFAGKSDGKTAGYEYHPVADGNKYKYIRLDCHGTTANSYNSLAEIKVYK